MININTVSFLISSFFDVINQFGSTKKAMDFYRNQLNGMTSISQVSQSDVDIINELINFSYVTDKDKWETEIQKVNYFNYAMDLIINNADFSNVRKLQKDVRDITYRLKVTVDRYGDWKVKVLRIIRKAFEITDDFYDNKQLKQGSGFGTTSFTYGKKNNLNNVKKDSTPLEPMTIEQYKKWATKQICKVAKDTDQLRVENLDAVCSCDPSYFYYQLRGFFEKSTKDIKEIFGSIAKKADWNIGTIRVEPGSCSGSTRTYETNFEAKAVFSKLYNKYWEIVNKSVPED